MASKFAWMVLGCVAALGGFVAGADAQSCGGAADSACPKGFSCEVTAVSGCATPAAMPEPAGLRAPCDGGECFVPADLPAPPVVTPPCAQQEYRSCVPGHCMTDGDCASGMVCHERSTGTCSAPAAGPCAPGAKCAPPPMPTCTETVERTCVPRYVLPCSQASDCGAGFTCEAQEICGCSGSAGAGSAGVPAPTPTPDTPAANPAPVDAGAASFAPAKPLPPPDCKCEPTPEKYCKVIESVCRADSDCPSEFYCQQSAPAGSPVPDIACAPPSGNGDAGVCSGGAAKRPAPVQPTYRCVPRYENIDPGYSAPRGGGTGGTSGGFPVGTPVPEGQQPTRNPSVPPTTTTPGNVADAGVSGPASGEAATVPSHVRACSVSTPGSGDAHGLWAVLGMLGLAIGVRRRRAG